MVCNLLCLLIVYSDGVVLPSCAETAARWGIVQSHYVVPFLACLEDLFPCLGRVLEEVSVGIGHQDNCSGGVAHFVEGSPAERIDGSWVLGSCIDLSDFVIGPQIENPYKSITISTGGHGVFMVEFSDHQFSGLRDDSLHEYFVLEWDFLDYSTSGQGYL